MLALPASSEATTKRRPAELGCEIIDHGNYVHEVKPTHHADANSVTGERFEINVVRFVRQTKQIEATLGQRFGIRYRLSGLPQRPVVVTWRITYPTAVRTFKGWEHSFRDTPAGGELVQHLLYHFTRASELLPGRWIFQVFVDGKPKCSFDFDVQ